MQVYLAVTPGQAQAAAKYRRPLAHVAYRIGEGSVLLRQNLLLQTQGGLLSVSDRKAPVIDDPEALCAAVLRECGRRNYQGILLDFEEPPRPDRQTFIRRLDEVAGRRALYLPERYAEGTKNAVPLICAAVSGGNFTERLREAAGQRGGRLALDMERLRMDFRLPAPTGQGEPLSAAALSRLMEQEAPAVFFSRTCAPATLLTPGTVNVTSSFLTTPKPSGKSCGPEPPWGSPPPFSCGRRYRISLMDYFSHFKGDRVEKTLCHMAQRF